MKNIAIGVSCFLGFLVLIAIFFGINSAVKVGNTAVDRVVLEQSHQYQEGMRDRAVVLTATLAEIDARLLMTSDPGLISDLEAQKAAMNIQLNAVRR